MVKDIKRLNVAELKVHDELLDKKDFMTVSIGEELYELEYDLNFRKSKQNKLLDDVIKFFQAGADKVENLEMATPYATLLILKHFTSLEVSDDIAEALELLTVLIDLEILDKMISELPEGEVTSVFKLLTRTIDTMTETLVENEEEAKRIKEQGE